MLVYEFSWTGKKGSLSRQLEFYAALFRRKIAFFRRNVKYEGKPKGIRGHRAKPKIEINIFRKLRRMRENIFFIFEFQRLRRNIFNFLRILSTYDF